MVLVVDDDALQCGEMVDFFTRQGIKALGETNGFAALHQVRKHCPRVVVMDMNMPGIDGLQAARLIGKLGGNSKIILVSGYPDFVHKAHRAGVDIFAVIDKPVPLRVLARFVNQAFEASPLD